MLSTLLHLFSVSGEFCTTRLSAGQISASSMAFLVLMFFLLLVALSAARGESVTYLDTSNSVVTVAHGKLSQIFQIIIHI